jgi:hypothetical protein
MRPAVALFLLAIGTGAPAWADCAPRKPVHPATNSYVLKGGTATDNRHHLIWQRCSVGQTWKAGEGCTGQVKTFSWQDATQLADDGWRLPTKDEIASLVASACRNPAINAEVFPGMDPEVLIYWTRSQDGPSRAWYINFADGSFRSYGGSILVGAVRLVKITRRR